MTQLQADIQALAKSHPVPSEDKLKHRMTRLDRMASFYLEKAPESKDGGITFTSYAVALTYAITMIKMYRKLTKKLAELAEAEK